MKEAGVAISTVISFLMLASGCASRATDETKAKIRSEIWREYSIEESEHNLDTTLVKGSIVKKKNFDENGKLKTLTEFPLESGIYKKVTIFDSAENTKTIETYYDKSEKYGVIEENHNDPKGNPIKKMAINIEDGKRTMVTSFEISNEYNGDGYLVKSISLRSDDTSETYITENSYNENGEIEHSILRDHSGGLISEVKNTYSNGKLINQRLSLPDVNIVKEIDIEYIDDFNRTEKEKVNGEIQRISDFRYENDQLNEISVNEVKRRRKKVVFIDRKFKGRE